MARKTQKIRTESYIRVNGELRKVDDLTPAQREYVAMWIQCELGNSLFKGKVLFSPPEGFITAEEAFPEIVKA